MKFTICLVLALAVAVSAVEEPKKIEKRGIYGGYGLPLNYGLGAPIATPLAAPIAPYGLGYSSPLFASGLPLSTGYPLSYGLSTYGLPLGGLGYGYGLPALL